jgi:thiamine-monophosphate kinase
MSRERALIDRLRSLAVDPAARGLADDAAVLDVGGRQLVLTHDMLVEGVHFLPADPPADVAWKLLAVNLSDLAAKGARPLGVLLGYPLAPDPQWDDAFVTGLGAALERFGVPLLGGDTVSVPAGTARQFGLTAVGEADIAPARSGAKPGDWLYVTGRVGAAGLGLAMARDGAAGMAGWLAAYRRPTPRIAEGRLLAPQVHAMADVSDGLLIDAARMAEASGVAVEVDVAAVPIAGGDRMTALSAGDDYELLCAGPPDLALPLAMAALTPIGSFRQGRGLTLVDGGRQMPLPTRLGYEHGAEEWGW